MEQSADTVERGAGKNKRKWTEVEDEKLVESLLELVNNGTYKADNGFKPGYLAFLENSMNAKLPNSGLKGKPHIESRIKTLKKDFTIVYDLRYGSTSGFGWDSENQVVTAPKDVWTSYAKADSSHKTGCFDHTCPGFVQTNKDIALGAAIHPISKLKGLPAMITIYIYKDFITNNWWLQYGDNINIGYWPPELFKILRYQANLVEWGGEVYSTRVGVHPHTRTAMGSGQFSDPGGYWISSGQILRMRVQENGHELKFPEYVFAWSEEYDCYDQYYVGDYIEDPEFYYGGPGRNWRCP